MTDDYKATPFPPAHVDPAVIDAIDREVRSSMGTDHDDQIVFALLAVTAKEAKRLHIGANAMVSVLHTMREPPERKPR